MLGYSEHDDTIDIIMKTIMWLMLVGMLFCCYLVYAGLTTYYAKDGEVVGQAKSLTLVTPFWSSFCPPYYLLDISLGVLQNGAGSMSTGDLTFTILREADLPAIRQAVQAAALVKVRYDTRRLAACTEDYLATGFQAK